MDINIEERVQKAVDLFKSGYNCSQSVFLAYNDLFAIEDTLAATLLAPLGGGMGRLREVCGAVSASFMIIGLKCLVQKQDDPVPSDRTEAYYKRRPCADYVAVAARIVGEKLKSE